VFRLGAARRRLFSKRIHRFGGQSGATRYHVAGLDKGDVLAGRVGHGGVAHGDELVHVELVVREQHEVLEPFGRGAGVVAQALQRIVHARRGEQAQGQRLAGVWRVRAVRDAVVHGGQVGQIEHVAHELAARGAHRAFEVVVLGEAEVHRNRLRAGAHLQRHRVVGQQQAELFQVVAGVQVGSGQRGLEAAGAGHESVAQPRVCMRHRAGLHAHERVAGADAGQGVGVGLPGQRLAGHEAAHGLAQVGQAGLVDGLDLGQCGRRIGEAHGGDEGGQDGHGAIVHRADDGPVAASRGGWGEKLNKIRPIPASMGHFVLLKMKLPSPRRKAEVQALRRPTASRRR
jgi:hypothetical protein